MTPDAADLLAAITATWPPAGMTRQGPFLLCRSEGGGSRVRAARLADPDIPLTTRIIDTAADWMRDRGQPVRFMVGEGQSALDTALAEAGYIIRDPTLILGCAAASVAAAPPPVTVFETWPPLAIQAEIWAEGGIGPDRQAVMARAAPPKISLFGRIADRPAGTAFLACHGDIAMLHAVEVTPAARRRGLARHMVRAAADWALRTGARQLVVLVTEENAPARALYASLGLQPMGRYHYRTPPTEG